MIAKYQNRYKKTISNALKKKSINIKDLDNFNINYIKEKKDNKIQISIIEEKNCNLKLNEYYKYNNRTIYTSCIKEIYIERNNNNS